MINRYLSMNVFKYQEMETFINVTPKRRIKSGWLIQVPYDHNVPLRLKGEFCRTAILPAFYMG